MCLCCFVPSFSARQTRWRGVMFVGGKGRHQAALKRARGAPAHSHGRSRGGPLQRVGSPSPPVGLNDRRATRACPSPPIPTPPPPPCCNRSHALPCYYQCVPPPLNHLFSCPLLRLDNEEKGANSAAAADASATPPHPVHVGEPAGRPLPRSAPARPLAPNPTPPPCPSPAQIPPCPPPPSAPSSPSPQPTVPRTPPSHRALSCNENCEPDRQRRRRCHRRRRWRGR